MGAAQCGKTKKKRAKTQKKILLGFLGSKPSKRKMTFFSVFGLKNQRNFFLSFCPLFFRFSTLCSSSPQRPNWTSYPPSNATTNKPVSTTSCCCWIHGCSKVSDTVRRLPGRRSAAPTPSGAPALPTAFACISSASATTLYATSTDAGRDCKGKTAESF